MRLEQQARRRIVLLSTVFTVLFLCILSRSFTRIPEIDVVGTLYYTKAVTKQVNDGNYNDALVVKPEQQSPEAEKVTMVHQAKNDMPATKMKTYYTTARTDRAGAQILDLILLEAYSFRKKGRMGGACVHWIDFDAAPVGAAAAFSARIAERQRLLHALGLDRVLLTACPTQVDLDAGLAVAVDRLKYGKTRKTFNAAWHAHLLSLTDFPYDSARAANVPLQVAVHVRRGDYDPCIPHLRKKYLPNEYYLRVLDEYLPTVCGPLASCDVTIYTDGNYKKELLEDFVQFEARKYTVDYNSTTAEIWRSFVNADVLVISKSSFSLVPALLNRNRVISPKLPYKVDKIHLAHWTFVPENITTAATMVVDALVEKNCVT